MTLIIIRVLLTILCFVFISSEEKKQNVTKLLRLNDTVVTEGGGPIIINKTIQAEPSPSHMIKVNPSKQNRTKSNGFEVPEKNDGKQSVGRKGVTIIKNISSTTERPKKPTLTEAEEDSVYVPSAKLNTTTDNHSHNIDESFAENGRKTDYIVPIVVVILSVPLVAILSSVIYKRGAEWWQHRHYRRMDFLIEGMYNN